MELHSLEHQITPDETTAMERDGFFVVNDALAREQLADLTALVDRLSVEERTAKSVAVSNRVDLRDMVGRDPLLFALVDQPTTIAKVWGILGWNIAIYHTLYMEAPPEIPAGSPLGKLGWHRDTGQLNRDMDVRPQPRVSVKVAYFLSDCSEPGRANFWVIPGSHLQDRPEVPEDGTPPTGARPVMVPAGAAVIFDRRLWHSSSPNTSQITRKVLFYGYAYRWLKPRDDQTVEHLFDQCDPIRRQLLGHAATGNYGFTSPTDDDVPLRVWLRELVGEEAAG